MTTQTTRWRRQARKRYYDLFKTLMPAQKVEALTVLLKLHIPMAADVNQALIEHGGQTAWTTPATWGGMEVDAGDALTAMAATPAPAG